MSKREVPPMNGDEGRPKRRKEFDVTTSPLEATSSGSQLGNNQAVAMSPDSVKDIGLKWWQVLRDATNKEGRNISYDFVKQPSKRLYPDYYQQIKQPIALDDIKKKLESNAYPSLESIKQDFDLCFKNARDYNMKESIIWKDAKQLQRLINKEYTKVTEGEGGDHEEAGDEEAQDGEHKKNKGPNMFRLLKTRLTKLAEKTDEDGRVMSALFMELPSKKEWPIYYKQIKRPVAMEGIFKHLKRKEYASAGDFARDVEQVFINAMEFNQEGTQIWEDARNLRDYFRNLMSDLPAPFALPQYSKPTNGKLKLKVPALNQISTIPAINVPSQPPANEVVTSNQDEVATDTKYPPGPSTVITHIPAHPSTTAVPTAVSPPAPSLPVAPMRGATKIATPAVAAPQPQKAQAHPQATPIPAYSSYYRDTNQYYSTSSSSSTPVPQITHPASPAPTPTVAPVPRHQLHTVSLVTNPRGRLMVLDHRDGVSNWAMRLGSGEKSIRVRQVEFLPVPFNDNEDSSADEEDDNEMEVDEEVHVVKSTKKRKGKSKGRPHKAVAPVTKKHKRIKRSTSPKIDEVQVKLNNFVVKEKPDVEGEWLLDVTVGMNIIEIGEKGGTPWKVYAERTDP